MTMLPIKSCYIAILLLTACTIFAQCSLDTAAHSDNFSDLESVGDNKVDDSSPLTLHKRPSFFVGSRYGRSGAGAGNAMASKTRRLNVVPRSDRFFLGSRYGKRAGELSTPYEQDNNEPEPSQSSGGPFMMSCVYLGLRNLYRCNSADEINSIINQLTTAQSYDAAKK